MSQERELSHASSQVQAPPTNDNDLAPGRSSLSAKLEAPAQPLISGLIQRKAERDANGVAAGADAAIASASSSSGISLPTTIQRKFESSLGADLSSVRVHTGSESQSAAHAVGAKAYTTGQDIHFGAGHYNPTSAAGEHLLAHEVAHTVQQQGGTPTRQNKLEVSAPQDAAEHEADRAADAMVSGGQATISGFGGIHREVFRDPLPNPGTGMPQLTLGGTAPPPTTTTVATSATTTGPTTAASAPTTSTTIGPMGQPMSNPVGNQTPLGAGPQSPTATGSADSSQFLRPTPTPIDPTIASSLNSIAMGQKAFGASGNWKSLIDWPNFTAWVNQVPQIEANIENTINPKIGSDLALVQHTHDDYAQRLGDAFAKERGQIEQIVKSDPQVMELVTHINTESGLIKAAFLKKSAALGRIAAAADQADLAASQQEQQKADDDKQKQQAYLEQLKTAKAAATAELEKIPEMLVGAAKVAAGVATTGPAALAEPAQKLAESLIMSGYKEWADKTVEAQYETQISNVQFKIRNIEAKVQNLKTTDNAKRVQEAAANAQASGAELQAANAEIATHAGDIEHSRVTLGTIVSQKYKQVASFRLASEATNKMKPLLMKYLADLREAKAQLKKLDPWQQWQQQLLNAAAKAAGSTADWMNGGPLPQPGSVQKPTPQQERESAEVDHYAMEISRVGNYVESENAHYDTEIEKVESGGYLDFVTQFDQALVGMLPTEVPGGK